MTVNTHQKSGTLQMCSSNRTVAKGTLACVDTSMKRKRQPSTQSSLKSNTITSPVLLGKSPAGQHRPSRVKVNGEVGLITCNDFQRLSSHSPSLSRRPREGQRPGKCPQQRQEGPPLHSSVALLPAAGFQPAGTLGTQRTVHNGTKDMEFCPILAH